MKLFVSEFTFHLTGAIDRDHDRDARGPHRFSVAVDQDGFLAATAFGDLSVLARRVELGEFAVDAARTKMVREEIEAYGRGETQGFSLHLRAVGSEFQKRVWDALRRIPFGMTRSYGELAKTLGSSARAVGRANATNPICLVVPCHRVIGADGNLTGFAFGQDVKRRLLEHEGAYQAGREAGPAA